MQKGGTVMRERIRYSGSGQLGELLREPTVDKSSKYGYDAITTYIKYANLIGILLSLHRDG